MEDESQQILESFMPDMDNQSILNFQQNNFEVPEQMFADSSLNENYIEEVIIGPDIATSDAADILDIPKSFRETNDEMTMVKTVTQTVPGVVKQRTAPGLFDPPNNDPPLRIASVLVKSEAVIPASNKLFLIPMGGIDTSMLQTNLKVPTGQNIIIIKPQDLLKSVQEQKSRLKTMNSPLNANQHDLILQQTTNINQQGIVPQASLSQALPIVLAHGPSQVNTMQGNVVLQANQVNHAGTSQPKVVVQVLKTLEGVKPSNLVNLEQQQVLQGSILKIVNPQNTFLKKNKPVNQELPCLRISKGQSRKIFQQLLPKSTADGSLNKANPGNRAQAVGQSQPESAVKAATNLNNSNLLIPVQRSSQSGQSVKVQQEIQNKQTDKTPQNLIGTTSEPLNKDSQGKQTCQDIMMTPTQPNLKSPPFKSGNKVSKGVHTMSVEARGKPQQNMHPGQPKAVLQVPKNPHLQLSKCLKITSPTVSTKRKIQIPRNLFQAMPIVKPDNQVVTQSKVTSVFSKTAAPKMPSSAPVAAPQLHSHTQSVWPSTKQSVVSLECAIDKDKPIVRKHQPRQNELEMSGATKTDIRKGPTLLGELEKRGFNSSSTPRMKNVRPGESQLKPLKHAKVNNTNPWTCCLCGKLSFEDSLGCLFGPYDEDKDVSQPDGPVPARKRKRDSNSDETANPTKSNSETNSEFWFHGDCIVWSPGIYVIGDSLAGYRQTVNESRFGKCTSCGDYGASLACLQRACKKLYHFPCAKKTECIFEDSNYTIQCGHHK